MVYPVVHSFLIIHAMCYGQPLANDKLKYQILGPILMYGANDFIKDQCNVTKNKVYVLAVKTCSKYCAFSSVRCYQVR